MLDQISAYLKGSPSIKPINYIPYYFDNFSFAFDKRYFYYGLVSTGFSFRIISPHRTLAIIKKKTEPILFCNIHGQYTFIGWRFEYVDGSDFDYSHLPDFNFGEFGNDFGNDFAL